jgi:hypothetical protein
VVDKATSRAARQRREDEIARKDKERRRRLRESRPTTKVFTLHLRRATATSSTRVTPLTKGKKRRIDSTLGSPTPLAKKHTTIITSNILRSSLPYSPNIEAAI